jgi:hypothetical protein
MIPSRTICDDTTAASPKPSRRWPLKLGPPTAHDIRRALRTPGRAGAPGDLLEALEAWSDGQMQQAA